MPSVLQAAEHQGWSSEEPSRVEVDEATTAVPLRTSPVPLLGQGGTAHASMGRTDTAVNGALIALGGLLVGWLFFPILLGLSQVWLSRPMPFPVRASDII